MNKSELVGILEQLGVRPSRKLGQHFLVDGNTLHLLGQVAQVPVGSLVLEIGAGTGSLTEVLLEAGHDVLALEYDARLAEFLADKYRSHPRLQVVHADAVRVDYAELLDRRPFHCVANLPYAVAGPILGRLVIDAIHAPISCHLLIQKEMADRLCARPGDKNYGALSVRIQNRCDVHFGRRVPATVFWPRPEVESAQVHLDVRSPPSPESHQHFEKVVLLSFSQRRKKLISLLQKMVGRDHAMAAIAAVGASETVRAEELDVEQFRCLSEQLRQI